MQKKRKDGNGKLRMKLNGLLLAAGFLVMFTLPAAAQEKFPRAKGPKPVGAVNSANGSVYEKGKYGIILKYISYKQDQLYDGNDEVDYVRLQKGQKGKKC